MYVSVIIAAAGSGKRMGGGIDKQYIMIGGMPVLAKSVAAFESNKAVGSICVVVKAGQEERFKKEIVDVYGFKKVTAIVTGGADRQESVFKGLKALPPETDYVLIHDGARPFVRGEVIEKVLLKAVQWGAAVPAVEVKDTIKTVDNGIVTGTPERACLRSVQTPQCFGYKLLYSAHKTAAEEGFLGTDDAALVEKYGHKVAVSEGDYRNIKITTPEDIEMETSIRCGTGFDVHAFAEDRKLILGGVEIPYEKGLLGHSDADVLAHAIMDALLGASGLGDIGKLFPDSDEQYKGISSMVLLEKVGDILYVKGFRIVNIDSVVIAQAPKIAPYTERIKQNIAEALGMPIDRISVKGTTTEGLGFTGRKEGIAANALAVISR